MIAGFTEPEIREIVSLFADFTRGYKVYGGTYPFVAYFIDGVGKYNFLGKILAFSHEEAKAKFDLIIGDTVKRESMQVEYWPCVFWKASIEDVANMAQSPFFEIGE